MAGAGCSNGRAIPHLQYHGTEKVVDKATYDRAVDTEERIWVSSAGFFGVAAAVLGAATVLRARVEE